MEENSFDFEGLRYYLDGLDLSTNSSRELGGACTVIGKALGFYMAGKEMLGTSVEDHAGYADAEALIITLNASLKRIYQELERRV